MLGALGRSQLDFVARYGRDINDWNLDINDWNLDEAFLVALSLLSTFTASALAGPTITVTHGKAPDPIYIDLGTPGESVGDQRIWQFKAKDSSGDFVVMDWVMLTMGTGDGSPEIERRMTSAVFGFSSSPSDRLLVEGIGLYPTTGATVKIDVTLERAIVGGTGKYAGARGTVLTTHMDDGYWQHELRLQ